MRNIDRIDITLKTLGLLWKKVPDWRFGQLICNLQKMQGNDLFYIEDGDFMDFCDKIRKEAEENEAKELYDISTIKTKSKYYDTESWKTTTTEEGAEYAPVKHGRW